MSTTDSKATVATGSKRKKEQNQQKVTKRRDNRKRTDKTPAGTFLCFTLSGEDVDLHRRSAFTNERKKEVKDIRDKKACLRCRILKRACSGDDPCKTCVAAAKAAAGSRALMWMECIRPSFGAMNIFDTDNRVPDQGRIDLILKDLLDDDVALDFHIPFALNVEAASAHLASWLDNDSAPSTFSVVGIFSCSSNTNLLENALDPNLGKDLRLFVHLTTYLYTTEAQGGYQSYTDDEIQYVRDSVGNRLLRALDPLLRPSALEASADKLGKLKSLFLLILGTTVGLRYTCPDIVDGLHSTNSGGETKEEALLRLLCHYLIYIGKATSLLEAAADEKALVGKWKTQWNKPAAFTWNTTKGLEMQYRIEPPTDWIVSSGENESMSSIDLDLNNIDEAEEFTVNTDLEKCMGCGEFGPCAFGVCQTCESGSGQDSWEEWLEMELDVVPEAIRPQAIRANTMVCATPDPVTMDIVGRHLATGSADQLDSGRFRLQCGIPNELEIDDLFIEDGGHNLGDGSLDLLSEFTSSFDSGHCVEESQQRASPSVTMGTCASVYQPSHQELAAEMKAQTTSHGLDIFSFDTDLEYFEDNPLGQLLQPVSQCSDSKTLRRHPASKILFQKRDDDARPLLRCLYYGKEGSKQQKRCTSQAPKSLCEVLRSLRRGEHSQAIITLDNTGLEDIAKWNDAGLEDVLQWNGKLSFCQDVPGFERHGYDTLSAGITEASSERLTGWNRDGKGVKPERLLI